MNEKIGCCYGIVRQPIFVDFRKNIDKVLFLIYSVYAL